MDKEIISKILDKFPVEDAYNDIVKPPLVEVSKVVGLPFKIVRALFAKAEIWCNNKLALVEVYKLISEKIKDIPPESLVEPESYIAVPALQAISYSVDNETLRQLYANLLSKSIQAQTKYDVHPAFVDFIKQMSPLDAKLLKYIKDNSSASCSIPAVKYSLIRKEPFSSYPLPHIAIDVLETLNVDYSLVEVSIDNLVRLDIINIDFNKKLLDKDKQYKSIENKFSYLTEHYKKLNSFALNFEGISTGKDFDNLLQNFDILPIHGIVELSKLGSLFCKICL